MAIRLGLAVIFVAHGGQKLFGIWGGPGLQTTIEVFERSISVPSYLTLIVVGTEFFGGLTVLVGFFTRSPPPDWPSTWLRQLSRSIS